jgi:hypothetical protein
LISVPFPSKTSIPPFTTRFFLLLTIQSTPKIKQNGDDLITATSDNFVLIPSHPIIKEQNESTGTILLSTPRNLYLVSPGLSAIFPSLLAVPNLMALPEAPESTSATTSPILSMITLIKGRQGRQGKEA